MFLNLLTPPQQRVFIQAARAVAEQDRVVEAVERSLLDALQAECGLDELPDREELTEVATEAVKVLDSDVAKRVFVLELAAVAVIDGDAHPSEVRLLEVLAGGLGIGAADLKAMFAFAGRAQKLAAEGQRLIATMNEPA